MVFLLCGGLIFFFLSNILLSSEDFNKNDLSKTWQHFPQFSNSSAEDLPLVIDVANDGKYLETAGDPHQVVTTAESDDVGEDITGLSNISRGSDDDDNVLNTKRCDIRQDDNMPHIPQQTPEVDRKKYPFDNVRDSSHFMKKSDEMPLQGDVVSTQFVSTILNQSNDMSPQHIAHTRPGSPVSDVDTSEEVVESSPIQSTDSPSFCERVCGFIRSVCCGES